MDELAAGHDAAVLIDRYLCRARAQARRACIADNNHQEMGRSLRRPRGALLLECIVYCHRDPGSGRKALFFCRGVDDIDDIRRERYIDDNVQTTFEAIDQPCDLTGEAPNKCGFFRFGQRSFSSDHRTVGTDKMVYDEAL